MLFQSLNWFVFYLFIATYVDIDQGQDHHINLVHTSNPGTSFCDNEQPPQFPLSHGGSGQGNMFMNGV